MTLLELIIVLAILSVTSDAIFSLMYASLKTYWKGDAATQAQQGARIATDRMIRDLRQARRLITGVTETAGSTSVTFNTGNCATAPQISFALPHLASFTLSDGSTIYDTDANASGTIPYDGWYVSYYLTATSNGTTANATGPYLVRASYDLVGNTLIVTDVANNITGLAFNPAGTCPGTSAREFTLQVTALQNQTGQNVSSKTIVTDDVALRNQ